MRLAPLAFAYHSYIFMFSMARSDPEVCWVLWLPFKVWYGFILWITSLIAGHYIYTVDHGSRILLEEGDDGFGIIGFSCNYDVLLNNVTYIENWIFLQLCSVSA
jgi:hypothetical protein